MKIQHPYGRRYRSLFTRRFGAYLAVAALFGACSSDSEGDCEEDSDCDDDEVCDGGECEEAVNTCDQASDICGGSSTGGGACSGQALCVSQCIVGANACDATTLSDCSVQCENVGGQGTGNVGNTGNTGNGGSGNTGNTGAGGVGAGPGNCSTCGDWVNNGFMGDPLCAGSQSAFTSFAACVCVTCPSECTDTCTNETPPDTTCFGCAATAAQRDCATQYSDCLAAGE